MLTGGDRDGLKISGKTVGHPTFKATARGNRKLQEIDHELSPIYSLQKHPKHNQQAFTDCYKCQFSITVHHRNYANQDQRINSNIALRTNGINILWPPINTN